MVQRTHEIGLRRAIGARDRDIVRQFLRQGGRQLRIGLLISALLAVGVPYLVACFAGVGVPLLTSPLR